MAGAAARAIRRAVALDMDGTVLNDAHAMTARTVEAIRRVDASGIQVVIATGRPSLALQRFVDQLALPRPVPAVCFNGACTLLMRAEAEVASQQVLFQEPLPAESVKQVLAMCKGFGWCTSYVLPARTVAAPQTPEHEALLARYESLEGLTQERLPDPVQLLEAGELPLKLVVMSPDPEPYAEQAKATLPPGLAYIVAAEMHIEFMSPSANKGRSLARLCAETLDIPLEQVIAFGDNNNDVEMLRLVGEGVAMRNAKEATKAAAHRVCAWSNDEEGVARELEQLLAAGPAAL